MGTMKSEGIRYTIKEIAEYIAGWHLSTESGALANALSQLRDDQDGIEAVTERMKAREVIDNHLRIKNLFTGNP